MRHRYHRAAGLGDRGGFESGGVAGAGAVRGGRGERVTTTEFFDTPQVASRYSGGGLDPTATFEKELLLDQEFGSRGEVMAALCAGLSDVRTGPLGAGMHGVWQGTTSPLGDGVECPQE